MRHVLAALALAAAAVAVAAAADDGPPRGACYCRAGRETVCVADLTERECKRRCEDGLADDWMWLERRPCWNWGYGG